MEFYFLQNAINNKQTNKQIML